MYAIDIALKAATCAPAVSVLLMLATPSNGSTLLWIFSTTTRDGDRNH